MTLSLPAARYGKDATLRGKVPQEYVWLQASAGLPEAVKAAADRWAQRFQWSGGLSDRHNPVALWLPLTEDPGGALLLRFSDAGPDDRGRPNTQLLEAAWASPQSMQDTRDLRARLLAKAMTDDPLVPMPGDVAVLDAVTLPLGLVATLSTVSVDAGIIVATSTKSFSLKGAEALVSVDAGNWLSQGPEQLPRSTPPRLQAQIPTPPNSYLTRPVAGGFAWGWLGVVLVQLVAIVWLGLLYTQERASNLSRGQVQVRLSELQAAIDRAQTDNEDRDRRLRKVRDALEDGIRTIDGGASSTSR
jgi:hypothetical protein